MKKISSAGGLFVAAALLATAGATPAQAEDGFYRGKNLTLIVGFGTGGGYDTYARLLARHWRNHIPGNPTVIVQNMPGASGIKSGNYLYSVAPRDGTSASVFNKAMPTYEVLKRRGVAYKSKEFNWIGSMEAGNNAIATWAASGIKTIDDARKREVIVGAVSASGSMAIYPALANNLLGTKFKIITGYKGSKGVTRAMEQGEVEGIGSSPLSTWTGVHSQWLKQGKINILAQIGPKRDASLPGPLLTDLAPNDEAREIIRFVIADIAIGRAVVAPPKIPAERTKTLRTSFNAAMTDPKLLAEGRRLKLAIKPSTGGEIQALVERLIDTPDTVVRNARAAIDPKPLVKGRK